MTVPRLPVPVAGWPADHGPVALFRLPGRPGDGGPVDRDGQPRLPGHG